MCGLTGFIDFNKKSFKPYLEKMTDVLYHRGPDDTRIFKDECISYDINIKYGSDRIGDMKKNYTSIGKIKKDLNWSPKVSLQKGFSQTFQWFLSQK